MLANLDRPAAIRPSARCSGALGLLWRCCRVCTASTMVRARVPAAECPRAWRGNSLPAGHILGLGGFYLALGFPSPSPSPRLRAETTVRGKFPPTLGWKAALRVPCVLKVDQAASHPDVVDRHCLFLDRVPPLRSTSYIVSSSLGDAGRLGYVCRCARERIRIFLCVRTSSSASGRGRPSWLCLPRPAPGA